MIVSRLTPLRRAQLRRVADQLAQRAQAVGHMGEALRQQVVKLKGDDGGIHAPCHLFAAGL